MISTKEVWTSEDGTEVRAGGLSAESWWQVPRGEIRLTKKRARRASERRPKDLSFRAGGRGGTRRSGGGK